jgi:Sulfotransferase domain
LPIFKLSRAFGVGRRAKVFFYLQGGLTRGVVPDLEHHDRLVQKLSNARRKQKRTLEELRQQQRRNHRQQRKLRELSLENFQLRRETNPTNEPAKSTLAVPSAPQVPDMGALPDFVVIGAMRCGTSRFYNLLTRHPNVKRAATKEIHYFDRSERFDRGIEWYRGCFPPAKWKDGRGFITGEATPNYMYDPLVPERMARVVPEARLIALLRNPIDRAYSHYQQSVRRGLETRSFEAVVEEEQARLLEAEVDSSRRPTGVGYASNLLAKGLYVDQLQRWSRFFDEEQILVLKSEDFFKHTEEALKQVQSFLGLPHGEIHPPSRRASDSYEPLDPATRRRLEAYFEPYNQRLYEYLGVDFGW